MSVGTGDALVFLLGNLQLGGHGMEPLWRDERFKHDLFVSNDLVKPVKMK